MVAVAAAEVAAATQRTTPLILPRPSFAGRGYWILDDEQRMNDVTVVNVQYQKWQAKRNGPEIALARIPSHTYTYTHTNMTHTPDEFYLFLDNFVDADDGGVNDGDDGAEDDKPKENTSTRRNNNNNSSSSNNNDDDNILPLPLSLFQGLDG